LTGVSVKSKSPMSLAYYFARVTAALNMKVEDLRPRGAAGACANFATGNAIRTRILEEENVFRDEIVAHAD
jgi:hypothetical protein